jgi:hypothetical protein
LSKKKYFLTEEELKIIRDIYDGHTIKTNKIMRLLGHKYPRWYIKRKAQEMGLARCFKMPNWSPAEVEYLHENFPKKGFVAIQNGLKRINGGLLRSVTAIVLKKRRIGINKRSDGFTMRMVEDLLGADHHKIEKWVHLGWLEDGRKGTNRTSVQGGDMHHFEAKNLRNFVINYPEEIDTRRVEGMSFIHLVAGLL